MTKKTLLLDALILLAITTLPILFYIWRIDDAVRQDASLHVPFATSAAAEAHGALVSALHYDTLPQSECAEALVADAWIEQIVRRRYFLSLPVGIEKLQSYRVCIRLRQADDNHRNAAYFVDTHSGLHSSAYNDIVMMDIENLGSRPIHIAVPKGPWNTGCEAHTIILNCKETQ